MAMQTKGWGKGEWDELGVGADIHILPRVKQLVGTCCKAKELSSAFCSDLQGWDGGPIKRGGMGVFRGKSKREGIYVYIWLIHFIVQQRLTQHCKALFPVKQKWVWL